VTASRVTALRAVLLYTVTHFFARSADHALATRLAPYGRWYDARASRRHWRPVYVRAPRRAASAFATKLLLDATRGRSGATMGFANRFAKPS